LMLDLAKIESEEEELEGEEPEHVRRIFTRPDGNIEVVLRRDISRVTDEYIACKALELLSDEQVATFKAQNQAFLDKLYGEVPKDFCIHYNNKSMRENKKCGEKNGKNT